MIWHGMAWNNIDRQGTRLLSLHTVFPCRDRGCDRNWKLIPWASIRILHAPQSFVQCHHWIFEVLFPQFQSRFVSSQNVVLALWVIKILSTISCRLQSSKMPSLFGFHLASLLPLPYSFFVVIAVPPTRCLQLLCRSHLACQSASTKGGLHLSSAL